MNQVQGKVVSVSVSGGASSAFLEIDPLAACPRCANGRGCGAGVFATTGGPRRIDALVAPGLSVVPGERVALELEPRSLLRAALIVYGLPLTGAVSGALLAWLAGSGDGVAAGAALAGLALGLALGRRRLGQASCLRDFTPVVTKHLELPGSD
jgi:sigma-E factor negative regulatory protein RseC